MTPAPAPGPEGPEAIICAFRAQARWCARLGSPLTAELLDAAASALAVGDPHMHAVAAWPSARDPVADALALRFAGALHDLVLGGRAPELARLYPSACGRYEKDALWTAAERVLAREDAAVQEFIKRPPQTNEVRRSGVLLGGFLEIAAATSLPLALMELGASAGLNLCWDRYRYRLGGASWGRASPLTIPVRWKGPLPPLDAPVRIASRRGCDVSPLRVDSPRDRRLLQAYVWPDQTARLARLRAAQALAGDITVERACAPAWLDARLARPAPGVVRVVYHSVMWFYMPPAARAHITATLNRKGAQAGVGSPLAWLRMEPGRADALPHLTLTMWPGGRTRRLAVAHPHGAQVAWGAQEAEGAQGAEGADVAASADADADR